MCEPLMHIFSTQNKQDVWFEKPLSKRIALEGTVHLGAYSGAFYETKFLIPSCHKQNVLFRAHRHVVCT